MVTKNTKKTKEIILLNVSGPDKPGQTASLTNILMQYDINILDIGQSVIHDDLNLGILFEVPEEAGSSPILKDILFKAYELGVNVRFTPIPAERYADWVAHQGKPRYIVTIISHKLKAGHLAKVTSIIAEQGLNIDAISRLSGRTPIDDVEPQSKAVVEISVRGIPSDLKKMKSDFMRISSESSLDIAFQEDNVFRRNRRLICFDMDSTLIQTEVIDELARYAGVGDEVSAITASAMRGEIDFRQSFLKRISLLKGLDESVMKQIAENLPITDGAERLFKTLKRYGYRTAILSGGFTYFGNYLKNKLDIDYVFANELEIVNGKLTGNNVGDIVDGARKAEILKLIAVGDGSNDLPMLQLAGLGIAFHAKPKVQESAQHSISAGGLDSILYFLGFRDRDINQ